MSALILDFAKMSEHYPVFLEARLERRARAREIQMMAASAYRERVRCDEIALKRSAAGKLGAAAAKGKPRHCRFCRATGHYGNACPTREVTP